MKKSMAMLGLAVALSLASSMTAFAAWEQKDGRWYYYDGQGKMLKDTWVGNYYVGTDGAMMTDTLTPGGYWLDGTGLASEEKRVYGDCVFHPTSYQAVGNGFRITGDICSAGYASEEYLRSLKVGDIILLPADGDYAEATVFDTRSAVTSIRDTPGYYHDADGVYQEDGTTRRAVGVERTSPSGVEHSGYTFYSDTMWSWEDGSMEAPLYRIIEKDVVLLFDGASDFVPVDEEWTYTARSMSALLEKGWRREFKVKVTGGHIILKVVKYILKTSPDSYPKLL